MFENKQNWVLVYNSNEGRTGVQHSGNYTMSCVCLEDAGFVQYDLQREWCLGEYRATPFVVTKNEVETTQEIVGKVKAY